MDKPGWKTTEFLLAVIGTIGGLLLSVAPDNPLTQIIGGVLAAVAGPSYITSRSWAKGKKEATQANAKIVAETLLKKSSSG
jgi:uncharacterized membrane protein YfcA|tara:strand:- start:7138 stop:7380 length:243 start_codon:yes stop_codon:yes gene_type:complete